MLVQATLDVARTSPLGFQGLPRLPAPLPAEFTAAASLGSRCAPTHSVDCVLARALRRLDALPEHAGVVSSARIAPREFLAILVSSAAEAERGAHASVYVPLGCCTRSTCDVVAFNTCCWRVLQSWCDAAFSPAFWDKDEEKENKENDEELWNAVVQADERRDLARVLRAIMNWLCASKSGNPRSLADVEKRLRHERRNTYLFAAPWNAARTPQYRCMQPWLPTGPQQPFVLEASTEPRERALAYGALVGALVGDLAEAGAEAGAGDGAPTAPGARTNEERLVCTGVRVQIANELD